MLEVDELFGCNLVLIIYVPVVVYVWDVLVESIVPSPQSVSHKASVLLLLSIYWTKFKVALFVSLIVTSK